MFVLFFHKFYLCEFLLLSSFPRRSFFFHKFNILYWDTLLSFDKLLVVEELRLWRSWPYWRSWLRRRTRSWCSPGPWLGLIYRILKLWSGELEGNQELSLIKTRFRTYTRLEIYDIWKGIYEIWKRNLRYLERKFTIFGKEFTIFGKEFTIFGKEFTIFGKEFTSSRQGVNDNWLDKL